MLGVVLYVDGMNNVVFSCHLKVDSDVVMLMQ